MASADDILKLYTALPEANVTASAAPVSKQALDILKMYTSEPAKDAPSADATPTAPQWWEPRPNQSMVDSAAVGAVRGGKDVVDTLAHGLARGTDAVSSFLAQHGVLPQSAADAVHRSAQDAISTDVQGRNAFDKAYADDTVASVGRFGGQLVAATPFAVGNGVIAAAAPNRLMGMMGSAAANGAGFNALTSSASDKPVGEQALTGGLLGLAGGAVMGGAGAVANKIIGPAVDDATAAVAKKAAEYGIPIRAPQLAGPNAFINKADQMAGQLPFSGQASFAGKQQEAFNRAVSRTFGQDAPKVTEEVMGRAKDELGKQFDMIARQTTIKPDAAFGQDLAKTLSEAQKVLPENEAQPILKQVGEIWDKVRTDKQISGETYQALTRKGAPLDRLMSSDNPNIAFYAGQVRDALDGALERNAPPDMLKALQTARLQYKNLMTVAPLTIKGGVGDISPTLLNGRVNQSFTNRAFTGAGQLGDIAQIGQQFLRAPKDSSTPIGNKLMGVLTSPGTAIGGLGAASGGYLAGGLPTLAMGAAGALGGLGATALTARGVSNALNSQYVRNRLLGSVKAGHGNKLLNAP